MAETVRTLSRRRLLGTGLGIGGLVLAGGLGATRALWGRVPGVSGLRVLTPSHFRAVQSLAEALFPGAPPFPEGPADHQLAVLFDGFLADEPEWNQTDLKRALVLLEAGPLLFERRLSTFSRLSAPERLRHFLSWQEADAGFRRQAAVALRRFLSLVYYDRPEVWESIGYDGPLIRLETP